MANKGFSSSIAPIRPPSGQGSKKNKKPKEDKESGYSTSYARLLGVLSEGPIEGPIGWTKGIYLDETPLEVDGNFNFQGLAFDFRPGTRDQASIPGYTDDATAETAVNSEVKLNLPITRSIINANLDQIIVRLGFQLQEYPPQGGARALSVEFRILIKQGLGPFVEVHRESVRARWSSPVELSYSFNVNNLGGTTNNFVVRVERITAQDTDQNRYQRVITWKAYSEVVATKLNYAFSALAAMQFEAKQFDSLPQASFLIGGRLIQIPSNATVDPIDRGLIYSGSWDGTFVQAPIACADPTWIFYDLVTNRRYGLGKYINASKIDKWTLYELSIYCNEIINAPGGQERRYLCHVLIQDKQDAWNVLDALRSVFRGFLYWLDGAIHLAADRPGVATMIVTQADIEGGMFSYSRTPLRSRHTIAHVTWLDPGNLYKRTIETVEDVIGIERYGDREIEMAAFGCTSQTQAHRAGWAAILSERLELETVRFRIRPYGAYAVPGKIVKTMDIKRSIVRYGGLVRSCTINEVTLDHPVEIESGTYTISLMLPDGSITERTVYNGAGSHTVLSFEAFSYGQEPPDPESPWILASSTVLPGEYRVISVVPVSGENGLLYEISALQYVDEKYGIIDTDYYIPPLPPAPKPPTTVPPPLNLQGTARQTITTTLLSGTWEKPPSDYITGYIAEYRTVGGEWGDRLELAFPSAAWDVANGQSPYSIRVACTDVFGAVSSWVELEVSAGFINLNFDLSTAYSWMGWF
jgi:predicted phage tail protein